MARRHVRMLRTTSFFTVVMLLACIPLSPWAQLGLPLDRPGDVRPELPDFEPPGRERGKVLPPIPLPEAPDTQEGLPGGRRVFIRGYRITGNTVLSDEELAKITEPYANRAISFADLQALRDRLTFAYIKRGYISSGAVIPNQRIQDGILEIRIVEGVLADIDIESDGRFRESYLRRRVRRYAEGPVNVYALEEQLQILQQDDRIQTIQAELVPGEIRGESQL